MAIYYLHRRRTQRLAIWYWGRKTYRFARKHPLGRFGIACICLGIFCILTALYITPRLVDLSEDA